MKIRISFIGNSSSSSFLGIGILGSNLPKEQLDKLLAWDDLYECRPAFKRTSIDCYGEQRFIGIGYYTEGGFEEFSIEKLAAGLKIVKEDFEKLGISNEPSIWVGEIYN